MYSINFFILKVRKLQKSRLLKSNLREIQIKDFVIFLDLNIWFDIVVKV